MERPQPGLQAHQMPKTTHGVWVDGQRTAIKTNIILETSTTIPKSTPNTFIGRTVTLTSWSCVVPNTIFTVWTCAEWILTTRHQGWMNTAFQTTSVTVENQIGAHPTAQVTEQHWNAAMATNQARHGASKPTSTQLIHIPRQSSDSHSKNQTNDNYCCLFIYFPLNPYFFSLKI